MAEEDPSSLPSESPCLRASPSLLAPYRLVMYLIIIIRIIYVIRSTVILYVISCHQVNRCDIAARRLAGQRAVKLINKWPTTFVERFRNFSDLIFPGTYTVEGCHTAIACRDKGGWARRRYPSAAKGWRCEIEVEVIDAQSNRPILS